MEVLRSACDQYLCMLLQIPGESCGDRNAYLLALSPLLFYTHT